MTNQEEDKNYVDELLNFAKYNNTLTAWMYFTLASVEFKYKYCSPNIGCTTYSAYLCELDAMQKYPFGWYGLLPSNRGKVCNWKNNIIDKNINPTYFYSY